MTQLRFKAYYDSKQSNPLDKELLNEDVDHNLSSLESDFVHSLDENAKIEVIGIDYDKKQVEMSIQADCSEGKLWSVIEEVLKDNQLIIQNN